MTDFEEYPHWMDRDMICAAQYASIRHIRQTLVRSWSESCYVVIAPPLSCLDGKWPNIKILTERM